MISQRALPAVVLGLFLLTAAPSVNAEIGPYVGLSAGQARVDLDPGDVGDVDFAIDDDDSALRAFLGLELLGPLAVEIGYRDLGRVTDGDEQITVTSASDGFDAFAIGFLPLGPVAVFAKGGFIAWDTELERRANDGVLGIPDTRVSDDGTDFAWGLGVKFELGSFAFRGEYERLELDLPDSVSVVSVGLAYEF